MRRAALFASLAAVALGGVARADGFRIVQGGPTLGNAGAGAAALAEDASTAFFNPAGMTFVPSGVTVHASAIRVSLDFEDDRSTTYRGQALTGGAHERLGATSLVPAEFAVRRIGEDAAVGLAVTTPFGLSSEYPSGWVGRYQATRSSLETLDVAPCAALRLSPKLSVGVGVDFQYLRADLRNAVDFGTIAAHRFGDAAPSLGLTPQKDDGRARLTGEDLAFSGNAGVLWQATPDTRVGLALRGPIRHSIDGEARFVVPKSARRLRLGRVFEDTGAKTVLTLPEVVSLDVAHAVSREWTLLGGLDFTRWSRFQELNVRFGNPRQPPLVEDQSWRDTWRPEAGAMYRPDSRWTFRAGLSWDPATVDDAHRRPRAPDAARLSMACGVGYRVSDTVVVDFSYLRAIGRSGPIDVREQDAGRLRGDYGFSLDYLSLDLSIAF